MTQSIMGALGAPPLVGDRVLEALELVDPLWP